MSNQLPSPMLFQSISTMNGTQVWKTCNSHKKPLRRVNVPLKRYKTSRLIMTSSSISNKKSKTSSKPNTKHLAKSDLPLKGELVLSKYGSPIFNNNNNNNTEILNI